MKTLITALALAGSFIFGGCKEQTKYENSEILYEKGKVMTTLYNKRHSSSDIGVGMSTGGDLVVTSTSTTIPEQWGAVFRCEHGDKFPIQGSDEKYQKLWRKLDEGDSVRILYKKNYKVVYDRKTKQVINKELIDYDFIDAEKIGGKK